MRSLVLLAFLAAAFALPMRSVRSKHAAAPRFEESHAAVAPAGKDFFKAGNFRFVSEYEEDVTNEKFIGSLYFTTSTQHARMRLCHDAGPSIGSLRPDGVWVFFQDEVDAGLFAKKGCIPANDFATAKGQATAGIVEVKNDGAFPDGKTWADYAGWRVYEWTLDANKGYCSIHPSRGRVLRTDALTGVKDEGWAAVYDAVSTAQPMEAAAGNTYLGEQLKALIDAGKLPADFKKVGCFPEEDALEVVELTIGPKATADVTTTEAAQIKTADDAVVAKNCFSSLFDTVCHLFSKKK
jgi:hypothetical protein